jgi:beta-1,4-glucosyltransferase
VHNGGIVANAFGALHNYHDASRMRAHGTKIELNAAPGELRGASFRVCINKGRKVLYPKHPGRAQSCHGTPYVPTRRDASSILSIEETRSQIPGPARAAAPGIQQRAFAVRRLLGVGVHVCFRQQALDFLLGCLSARTTTKVAFANMHLLSTADMNGFRADMLDDFLVLNDGVGMDIASLIQFGRSFPDNPNGTDLVPTLLKAASKETRVFLYGATPTVVARAAQVLSAQCDVTICGTSDGYGVMADSRSVPDRIRDSAADVVLVALGNPKQEMWIAENAASLGAPLVIGVGALFDIITGTYPRAPAWIQRVRLEWAYRTALEPRRLWNRYTVEAASFFYKVVRQKFGRSR